MYDMVGRNLILVVVVVFFCLHSSSKMRSSFSVLLCLGVLGLCVSSSLGYTLYGQSPVNLYLDTIDPVTSNTTEVGVPDKSEWPRDEHVAEYKATIDTNRKVYYVAAHNKTSGDIALRGMSLVDGTIVNQIPLPFKPTPMETIILSLDYKAATDSLIVSGSEDGSTHDHSLYTISLSNNKLTKLSTLPTMYEVLSGNPSCFDSDNDLMWIVMNPEQGGTTMDLYGFSCTTGKEVHHYVDANYTAIHALQYSPKMGVLVANSQTRGLVPTLLNIKPASGAILIVGKYPQYSFVVLDNACAIDKDGNFYTYQTPDSTSTYYQLVTFAPDGTVLSEPRACDEINYCPLNIAGIDD